MTLDRYYLPNITYSQLQILFTRKTKANLKKKYNFL